MLMSTKPCANVGYRSKRHISFSAQGWQEYEELVADARIAYKEHLDDLVKRVDAFEEQSRPSQ
jgi:hypothetical protein